MPENVSTEREWLEGLRYEDKFPACPDCGGSGEIHSMHHPTVPQTEDYARCGRCHGTGDIAPEDTSNA